jgi:hypothetical protein
MRAVRIAAAVICAVVGLVWFGQGIGRIGGSFMTGQGQWSIIGLLLIAISVLLLASLLRPKR